ncbi:hypothetical protein AB0P21_25140 [Kribbella sp. NPDC056861]|uniref:hypothetical protein n=1 Tax=Kribbella sp. NPDC056861 TaxID=3154857 RepID=UPI00343A1E64
MNGILVWFGGLGLVLIVEGLLARYELLAYSVGWRSPTTDLPDGLPYARGAAPDRPPAAYLVYLDGIGKRQFRDTRDGGQLVRAVIAGAPELRVLGRCSRTRRSSIRWQPGRSGRGCGGEPGCCCSCTT